MAEQDNEIPDSSQDDIQKASDNFSPKYRDPELPISSTASDDRDDKFYQTPQMWRLRYLYQRNPLANRIVDKRAEDPIEKWLRIKTSDDDFRQAVKSKMSELSFKQKLMDLNFYASLDGSAGLAYGLKDSAESPEEEVNPDTVSDIDFLNVITQRNLAGGDEHFEVEQVRQGYELNSDPESAHFGDIEYYRLPEDGDHDTGDKFKIHRSRFHHLRPSGVTGSPEGMSVLRPVYSSLVVFENIQYGAGQTMFISGTGWPTLSVENYEDKSDDKKSEIKNNFLSQVGSKPGMVKDKETEVEFKGAQGKAIDPAPYHEMMKDVLGAGGLGSKTVLWGTEGGELTGSEVNQQEYYSDIRNYQEKNLTPIVEDFIQRLIDYGLVDEPDEGFEVEWNDLFELSEEKRAELQREKSKAFMNYKAAGLSTAQAAEQAGLDDELIEELTESEGSSEGESGGETQGNSTTEVDAVPAEDKEKSAQEIIDHIDEADGFDSEEYFSDEVDDSGCGCQDADLDIPAEAAYADLNRELTERFDEFIETVADLVDESVTETDRIRDKLSAKLKGQDAKDLNKELFRQRLDRELRLLEEDSVEITEDNLQQAFLIGATEGADAQGFSTSEVFDKHRQEILNNTVDKWSRPAYADTTDEVSSKINDEIERYFKEQDTGRVKLKNRIRDLAGDSDKALDYRYNRIARTETARLRNLGYIDETSRRGRSLYDWSGNPAPIPSTPPVCLNLIAGNPWTKEDLLSKTDGGLPHINCRRTAIINSSEFTDQVDGNPLEDFEQIFLNLDVDADMEELDEVYTKYKTVTNLSHSQLEDWADDDCSSEASLSRDPIKNNLRLLDKNKSDWDEDDIRDAKRAIQFVSRMMGVFDETDEPRDGPGECPAKVVIALRNWARDPLNEIN